MFWVNWGQECCVNRGLEGSEHEGSGSEVSGGSKIESIERVVLMVEYFRVRKKPGAMETPRNPQGQH